LRREARSIFFAVHRHLKGLAIQVHHRIPLEWRRLFPLADPNRLANLQGLPTKAHLYKATHLWDAFRDLYRRLRRAPTAGEVLKHAELVDRSLNLPHPLD
jgi:hypothetical protein